MAIQIVECLEQHRYNVAVNPYYSLEKIKKKTHRKMFSQTNYMKQESTKNHLASAKTNRISKYTLSVQKIMLFIK